MFRCRYMYSEHSYSSTHSHTSEEENVNRPSGMLESVVVLIYMQSCSVLMF
jgi:hypothetical protein